ncbi:hypothetical protein ACRAWF_46280 [Streptomyces sp. L7]
MTYAYNTAGDLTDVYGVGHPHPGAQGRRPHRLHLHLGTPDGVGAHTRAVRIHRDPDTGHVDDLRQFRAGTDPDRPDGQDHRLHLRSRHRRRTGRGADPGHRPRRPPDDRHLHRRPARPRRPRAPVPRTPVPGRHTYDPVTLGVTSVSDPDGNLQTFTYDDHGNKISESNARGFTTSYLYDDSDNLTRTIDPSGLQTVYGYDESGHSRPAAPDTACSPASPRSR